MKIKVDEDLPKAVAESLRRVIPDTPTVLDEGLSGALDPKLWDAAQGEGRFLITGGKAFANIRKYPPGTHHGVLLLRPKDNGIFQMLTLIEDVLKLGNLENLAGCIAAASHHRLKVRRPKIWMSRCLRPFPPTPLRAPRRYVTTVGYFSLRIGCV